MYERLNVILKITYIVISYMIFQHYFLKSELFFIYLLHNSIGLKFTPNCSLQKICIV